MKKRSLIFGVVAFACAALVFLGCESPTDGSSGSSGTNGPATFNTGTVDAAALEAVYAYTDTVVLANGVSSVDGLIPAGKKLVVAGSVSVTDGKALEVTGALEIADGVGLDASYVSSSAGYLKGSGQITGGGGVALPYIASDATGAPEGIITYASPVGVSKAAASYFAIDASSPAGSALGNSDVIDLFTLSGEAAINELSVVNITGLTATAVPSGKTLKLSYGKSTTTADLDLSGNVAGILIVEAGAVLEAANSTSIKGKTGDTSNITVNGAIKLASNATALSITNVNLANATIDAADAGAATLTLPASAATIKAIAVGGTNDLAIAGATELRVESITSGANTIGVKSASVAKYSTSDDDYVSLASASDTFVVTKVDGNVFSIATDTSAVAIGSVLTIKGDAKLKTEGTGGISVTNTNLELSTDNLAKFVSGSTISYSDAVAGKAEALVIPAGITVKPDVGSTLATITGLTVNGVLDLGTNTALTLAGIGTSTISTGEKGVIKSAITDATKFGLLLSKAGDSLAIEQTGAVTLSAATTVKAGTTLTIGTGGTVTVGASTTLTVAGTVDATEGTLTVSGGTITVTGDGQIIGVKTYSLTDNDGTTPVSGTATTYLDGTAVQTVDSDGKPVFTITVTSKTGTKVPAPTTNVWGTAGDGKPTGKFSDLALDMSAAITDTSKTYAVKTTTLGLLYYAGTDYLNTETNSDGNQYFVTNTDITAPQPEDKPDVYISADKSVAFKWKKYDSSTTLITNKNHGVLLYDGASEKIVTLEIDEVGTDDALTRVATIVINYDGVTFAD